MEKYIIYSDEENPVKLTVVTARDAEHAKYIYAQSVEIKDPRFLEYVYTELSWVFEKDVNGSFYIGLGPDRVLRSDLTEEQASEIFEQNVRTVFLFVPEYADLYLKFMSSDAEPMEEPHQYVVSETFGLIPCSKDTGRRWNNYIRRTHERWQFPEDMLVMLSVAAWTEDRKIVPIKDLEVGADSND